MSINELKPAFSTENLEVFRATCMREKGGSLPIDVFIAFFNFAPDEPLPEPACMITIRDWNTWVERSKESDYDWNFRTVEWVYVPEELRRQGIATEVVLAIQEHIGPLSDCDDQGWYKAKDWWPEDGQKFFDAIGPKLLGDVAGPVDPEDEDWGGCQPELKQASGDE